MILVILMISIHVLLLLLLLLSCTTTSTTQFSSNSKILPKNPKNRIPRSYLLTMSFGIPLIRSQCIR